MATALIRSYHSNANMSDNSAMHSQDGISGRCGASVPKHHRPEASLRGARPA